MGRDWLTGAGALAIASGFMIMPAHADEPLFGFIYTTDLLPQDKWEVTEQIQWRSGKSHGSYNVWETRTEVEYGWRDDVQVALYANWNWTEAFRNDIDRTTLPAETFAEWNGDPLSRMRDNKLLGISGEVIWRILSPYTDGIGLALYVEPTVGDGLFEEDTRLILQKNFLDDRLVIGFNVTVAQEFRYLPGDPSLPPTDDEFRDHWDKETDVNFGLGVSYRFAPGWSAAWEIQNEREWAGLRFWDSDFKTNSAWYTGPTIHYAGEHYFFTATVFDQLPWADDYANQGAESRVVGGRNYADDFERFRVRLKFGYYF